MSQALARIDVKDAKIEELSDSISRLEKKLVEQNELVEFFRRNQTDECKVSDFLNSLLYILFIAVIIHQNIILTLVSVADHQCLLYKKQFIFRLLMVYFVLTLPLT